MANRKTHRPGNTRAVERARALLDSQRVAVLGTHQGGQPYSSLVAIAASADLKSVVFATLRATQKFENLTADPRASLMIDNRTNDVSDLQDVTAVTALGPVEEIPKKATSRLMGRYVKRHPSLAAFVKSPGCALLRMKVDTYVVVTQFQKVQQVHPRQSPARP